MSHQSDYSSSESSESSDSDVIEVNDVLNEDFFKTLSCLKRKDPRIYDPNVKFFNDTLKKPKLNNSEVQNKNVCGDSSTKKCLVSNKTYFHKALNDSDDSSDGDDIKFKVHGSNIRSWNVTDPEHIEYLKGTKHVLNDKKKETELKALFESWNNDNLDPNEKFIKDYILNSRFLEKEYKEVNLPEVDLSEDERELEEQEDFEENYNRRFESEENLSIKRYPRNIDNSLRRKNDARKKKRAEISQRKKEEKLKKHKELKKEQRKKLLQIEEKLRELKLVTGNSQLGFKDEEILDDFDPDKHDKRMQELFNDEFYSNEDLERPVFDSIEGLDDEHFNMDCDADLIMIKKEKLTRRQRKKNKRKKCFQDVMDIKKPSFDEGMHQDFKKYLDEYYSIDCEDFIEDIPCRFKYKEVLPNNFGLSVEEILMADDKELNRWACMNKLQTLWPEHVERNEINVYKSKSKNEQLKRKILKSLYVDPEEEENKVKNIEVNYKEESNTSKSNNCIKRKNKSKNIKDDLSALDIVDKEPSSTLMMQYSKKKKHFMENAIKNDVLKDLSRLESEGAKGYFDKQETENYTKKNNFFYNEGLKHCDSLSLSKSELFIKSRHQNFNKEQRSEKTDSLKNRRKGNNLKKLVSPINENNSNESNMGNKRIKQGNIEQNVPKKLKKKLKSSKNNIVNLSDNRLLAYGIKPKKFRAKIIYGQNS